MQGSMCWWWHLMYLQTFIIIGSRKVTEGSYFYLDQRPPVGQGYSFTRFLDHTHRRTTVGSTPLDEWSVRRGDSFLTTHNKHNRQTSMPPAGFEPTISAGERPHTYSLDCSATETGTEGLLSKNINITIYRTIILPVLCWFETWSVTFGKERRLRVFEENIWA
jgi:hypothetical protein